MIDPNQKLFRWGPIFGSIVYCDPWMKAFPPSRNYLLPAWTDTITNVKDGKVLVICQSKGLCDNGEVIFKKYVLDKKNLKVNYSAFMKQVKKILYYQKLLLFECHKYSEKELLNLLILFDADFTGFWKYGFIPELANWGGEQLLTRKLAQLGLNHHEIVEKLSAPVKLSFFQAEELEFYRIKLKSKAAFKNDKKLSTALQVHQQKYYWLKNNYGWTEVLDVKYFEDELNTLSIETARNKLSEISHYIQNTKKAKKEVIKKYKLSKEIIAVSDALAFSIWWQDLRKKYIWIANSIITEFLNRISRLKNLSIDDLCYYKIDELIELLKTGKKKDIRDRKNGFTFYYHSEGKLVCLDSKESAKLMQQFEVKVDSKIKEIKGMVVSLGKEKKNLSGSVKILTSPSDIHKLQKGEILVAPMTSPDYIFAMRKASAIITDEGGLTSHAAIVSRELGIPCIVGTGIATKVLKDNDKVMIDVKNGLITKL